MTIFGHIRMPSARFEFAHVSDVLVDLVHDGGCDEAVFDSAGEEVGRRAAGQTRV